MTEARTEIFDRIRAALADRAAAPAIPRDYDRHRAYPDLLGLAAERIEDYQARVCRVAAAEVPATIAGLLSAKRVHAGVAPRGVPAEWLGPEVRWLCDDPPLAVEQLDQVDAVVTGCAVLIAETGTIVLDGGPGQGRRALTLVPDYHLCVVRRRQVVATVPEGLARLAPERPLTFVSGPSATSDIELDRVEGVHGPRTLDVVLIEDREPPGTAAPR
ncbi:lactate utilization protein C [Amycolatopsis sp. La24]|uniref:LutC/YkgG family protein n=1 Tax=Amycolatopsis sp. La24 TaxID=3028304 RepID=UPI0023B0FE61|nr:lactate utilization protein C [Amycolatopsis sp. La24]